VRARIPIQTLGIQAADTTAPGLIAGSTEVIAFSFIRRNPGLFGVDASGRGLQAVPTRPDRLGLRHAVLQQKVGNIPVYNAIYAVHVDPRKNSVVAMTSSLIPNVVANATTPTIGADSARAAAAALLIRGQTHAARLVLYPGRERSSQATLTWVVEAVGFATQADTVHKTTDTVPARRDIFVDAMNGKVLDQIDRLYTARSRQIYTANNAYSLPGTLSRSEGQPPAGNPDVDSAYKFLGATYDYYQTTHGRDSYDNAGATLQASVHYGVNYENAYWDGTQMVFGDGFVVNDVTAHELTHAVTERTANLEYRWQSGALNESFSDIFGAMVDRSDWLMGEDMPIGAIRDLEHPETKGQPGNVSSWYAACDDNEGVHTNSGIFSKAFVNIATAIGKGDAEKIFYRALTTSGYLSPLATMEDARGAAIQSAIDLFGSGSAQVTATTNGFNAVGLNGSWQPPANSCTSIPPIPADLSTIAMIALVVLLLALVWRARARVAARA
jgi:Zn-dependent metalloprotease